MNDDQQDWNFDTRHKIDLKEWAIRLWKASPHREKSER